MNESVSSFPASVGSGSGFIRNIQIQNLVTRINKYNIISKLILCGEIQTRVCMTVRSGFGLFSESGSKYSFLIHSTTESVPKFAVNFGTLSIRQHESVIKTVFRHNEELSAVGKKKKYLYIFTFKKAYF